MKMMTNLNMTTTSRHSATNHVTTPSVSSVTTYTAPFGPISTQTTPPSSNPLSPVNFSSLSTKFHLAILKTTKPT